MKEEGVIVEDGTPDKGVDATSEQKEQGHNSGPWVAYKDDEGREYYCNNETEETTWDKPPDYQEPPETNVKAETEPSSPSPTFKKEESPSEETQKNEPTESVKPEQADTAGPWVAYKDDEDREYYFNTVTEETTWDKPADYQEPSTTNEKAEAEPSSPSPVVKNPPEDIKEEKDEESVDPESKRIQDAEKALNQSDAIMESDVMVHVTELVTSEKGNPQKAIQALTDSYYGVPAVCGLLSSWLAGLKSQAATSDAVEQSKLFTKSADDIRQMTQDVVCRIAKEKFTKTGGDSILHLASLPTFLEDMIDSNRWRKLLIDLSASNKDSALLSYCLQKISKRGHHREIARRINQSEHFAVFNAMLASELMVVGKIAVSTCHDNDTSIGLDELVSDLRRTCASTAYTYIYAIEVLRHLVSTAKDRSKSSGNAATSRFSRAVRKWERLNEALQTTMVDPASTAGSTPLFRKRRLDVALTISELHQRQRRRLRPSDDGGTLNLSGMEDRRAKVESSVLNFLKRYSLGTKINDHILDAMLPDGLVGDPTNLVGNLLIKRPLTVKALLGYMYKPGTQRVQSAVTRNKCARLIAFAVLAAEKEALLEAEEVDESVSCDSDEVVITRMISEGSQLCERLEIMVSFIVTTNADKKDGTILTPGEKLCSLAIKSAPVAQGVAIWAREQTRGSEFVISASYSTISPSILSLVRVLYMEHPFVREDVLEVTFGFLKHSNSEIAYTKMNEIKEQSLRLLLCFAVRGEGPAVLGRMASLLNQPGTAGLDAALIRYFVSGLIEITLTPFSVPFVRSLCSLLQAPGCVEAVQTDYFPTESKTRLESVMQYLRDLSDTKESGLTSEDAFLVRSLLSIY